MPQNLTLGPGTCGSHRSKPTTSHADRRELAPIRIEKGEVRAGVGLESLGSPPRKHLLEFARVVTYVCLEGRRCTYKKLVDF